VHEGIVWSGHSPLITFGALITGLWLIFLAYWFVAALRVKRSVSGTSSRGAIFRAAIAIGIVLLIQVSFRELFWRHVPLAATYVSPIAASAGVALCGLGIAIAIWGRTYLGQNWGMPMSLREGHELVTTGPYAFVRHPIYTGILLAVVGTTLVRGYPSIVLLAAVFAFFAYAATVEERNLMKQFPNEYPAYVKRTKMLIPFLF
jgi:protein-S-isoprenylcysteine O-methyltransferase Ste14